MDNKCVCCGDLIPEGHQVCSTCERKFGHIKKIETNFYDKEEIYENCTVQVLTNTNTGDVSIGWWQNATE
jgi:hypothetical protein